MLDTVVLTIKDGDFRITNHDKFMPSTSGLFYPPYYRLGARGNYSCIQNAMKEDIRNKIYKPRLTVIKRMTGGMFQIVLRVEFSAPKLLFGNNFDEIGEQDFESIIEILQVRLEQMDVKVSKEVLAYADISSIHYSKNITLTDYSTSQMAINELRKVNLNQKLDLNQTDFRNEGHSLKFRANAFELAFYDKIKDLQKAKISEKRAEEMDNGIQLNLFDTFAVKRPFEVLRMEVRLNNRRKIRQVLKKFGFEEDMSFYALYSKIIARCILFSYWDMVESSYPLLLSASFSSPKEFINQVVLDNPQIRLAHLLQVVGLKVLVDEVGIRDIRALYEKDGNKMGWYRINKKIKRLHYSKQNSSSLLICVRKQINDFQPLKLVDFQGSL